jgi:hypothetical protein
MGLWTPNKYIVKKLMDASRRGWVRYEVEELPSGKPSRKFTAELTHTQATRGNVEQLVERWCQLYPDKLPLDGGTFQPDPDNVERSIDRR